MTNKSYQKGDYYIQWYALYSIGVNECVDYKCFVNKYGFNGYIGFNDVAGVKIDAPPMDWLERHKEDSDLHKLEWTRLKCKVW